MKWFKRVLLGIAGLVLLGCVVFYAGSEYVINKHYTAESRTVDFTHQEAASGEGEHLAQVFGCYRGCHGRHMEGDIAFDEPPFIKAVAPSLVDAVRKYSPEQLETLIRQGVRPDGRSLWGMPSSSFANMTDRHLAEILGFIRNYPVHEREAELPDFKFYPGGRMMILTGMLESEATVASRYKPFNESGLDEPIEHGRYLAMNVCSQCHNTDLEGFEDFAPPLTVAKAYDRAQFKRLMSEGIGVGDRDLGLMSEIAKLRLSHFTDAEVDAIYDFLQSR